MQSWPDLKNELEKSRKALLPSYFDTPAKRNSGKVYFRSRELHDFACADALGFAQLKKIKRAAQESIEIYGFGCISSRKNSGTSAEHLLCEKALSKFFGFPAALLFSSRNQAVFSLLASLLNEQDQLICDEDSAGLLADISFLLDCNLEVVPLNDIVKLKETFEKSLPGRRRFVFADSVSASSARKLDSSALLSCCTNNGAYLIVDESMAAGILGDRGAGVLEEANLTRPPALSLLKPLAVISDLGLGLGCFGASLCADYQIVEAVFSRSKTLGVEPAIPSVVAAAIFASLEASESSFSDRMKLKLKLNSLLTGLSQIKQCLRSDGSSFVSVCFDKVLLAVEAQNYLFSKGFMVDIVPSPSKFSDSAFIRLFPGKFHSDETIKSLLGCFQDFYNKANLA